MIDGTGIMHGKPHTIGGCLRPHCNNVSAADGCLAFCRTETSASILATTLRKQSPTHMPKHARALMGLGFHSDKDVATPGQTDKAHDNHR